MKRIVFALLATLASSIGTRAAAGTAAPPPNVLLIFTDNIGYGDLGCYGNTAVKTPHMDRLASEGVRCTDFYIGSPSCAPSRGAILTGRHPERTGFNYQNIAYPRATQRKRESAGDGLPRSEKIIPYFLKPLGYATAAFGKWNVGFAPGSRPTERGFDEFIGFEGGNIHYYKHLYFGQNDMRRGTEPVDLSGRYSTDLFADSAIDFIQRHRNQPWFVYLPFNAVHAVLPANVEPGEKTEWQVPEKYLAAYGCPPNEPDEKKRYRAVLTALDDAIGRVLGAIDDLELRQRTVVLCISDNGAFMVKGSGLEVQTNAPLREGASTTFEGGVRVPAFFRWPGRIKPGTTCRELLSSLDVLPLILAATGAKLPEGHILDGRNPMPALAGAGRSPHDALHWVWNAGSTKQYSAMRAGDYKILRVASNGPWALYDLRHDIGESRDLANAQPERVEALAGQFERWHASVLPAAR